MWVARLHGSSRSRQMERECLAWQARSEMHRLAFEGCTDTWQDVAGVTLRTYARANVSGMAPEAGQLTEPVTGKDSVGAGPGRWGLAKLALLATAATVAALAGVLVLGPGWKGDRYDTGVGEQRLVVLQDGTRMSLNTSTRVRVDLGSAQRTVKVEGGEALFEVAKDASRPFIVKAAGSEVRATGTAFLVRYTPAVAGRQEALDVTLVEGRVVVRGSADGRPSVGGESGVAMSPGQRLHVSGSTRIKRVAAAPEMRVDRPRMDQVLAWTRGEALFEDVSLQAAVAEMNRYSSTPIRLGDADALGSLRVSGLFKTGDNLSFARAVSKLHGLALLELPDALMLGAQ